MKTILAGLLKRRRPGANRNARGAAHGARAVEIQQLEGRLLFAATPPHVTSVLGDNRGQVVLTTDKKLLASTVNKTTVLMFTAGADHKLHTTDDVKVAETLSLVANRLTVTADLTAGTAYRLVMIGSKITDATGTKLDGKFNGASSTSGNASATGSNLDIVVKPSATNTAHYTTVEGTIDVTLSTDAQVATTVTNYINRVNFGDFDNSFFHRRSVVSSEGISVIQGGGFRVDSKNRIATVRTRKNVVLQAHLSNLRGTIAMARSSADNSGNSQWYFNCTDNTNLNASQNSSGFAVFGQISNAHGLAVMDKINALPDVNTGDAQFATLPVVDRAAVIARHEVNPKKDLVVVRRIAMLADVVATSTVLGQTF